MADDFERLCNAAWQGSCASVARFGGNAISDEHGRAIVLAVLREQERMIIECARERFVGRDIGFIAALSFVHAPIALMEEEEKKQ